MVTLLHGSESTCVCDASERVRKAVVKFRCRSVVDPIYVSMMAKNTLILQPINSVPLALRSGRIVGIYEESREPGCMPVHTTCGVAQDLPLAYVEILIPPHNNCFSYRRIRRDVNWQPYLETTISGYWYCHCTASKGLGIYEQHLTMFITNRILTTVGTRGDRYDRYVSVSKRCDKVFGSLSMS
ncbi:hypothetical protein ACMD2_26952, partial [Ananas comosus]